MIKDKPRIGSIIWTDWPALFFLLFVPGIWIIGFLFPFTRAGADFGRFEIFVVALPFSIFGTAGFIWRIARIYRLFAQGRTAPGRITSLRFARDRARLEFEYKIDGLLHSSWTPVHKNKRTLALTVNQQVEALVDPADPSIAIIRQLYV